MKVCVIGAGPSGLVAAKTLLEYGHEVVVFESTDSLGGAFKHKGYKNCRLVSSRHITAFSDFRMTNKHTASIHPSVPEYVQYLEEYAEFFHVHSVIQFLSEVISVVRITSSALASHEKQDILSYSVTVKRLSKSTVTKHHFDAVAVCSGLHNVPHIPTVTTLKNFSGKVLHSSKYKESTLFHNKRVLIVGCGETGMDVAYQAVYATCKGVSMCIRGGFLSIPHQINDLALDTLITNLGECAYQHRWVELWKIKWTISTFFIRAALFFSSGTTFGYDQWVGRLPYVRRGHYIINKQVKAMPFLNREDKQQWPFWSWMWRRASEADDLSRPPIKIYRSSISHAKNSRVYFEDGTSVDVDIILLATGYKQRFPFLFPRKTKINLERHLPDADDPLPTDRLICAPGEPKLAFLGFVRPNVGAIPPMAELQCLWWLQNMAGSIKRPLQLPTYELLSKNERTRNYAVDYGAYMHDLARDAGSAPDLFGSLWWLQHPRILIAYCLGQAYIPFFRLKGPWMPFDKSQHLAILKTAEDELFDTVAQRGMVMNIIFGGTALAFSGLNAAAYILDCSLCIVWSIRKLGLAIAGGYVVKKISGSNIIT